MTTQLQRYRVTAEFLATERDALDALCRCDYRPPAEQLRWLVMAEAVRRGLAPARKNENGGAADSEAQRAAAL